MCARVHVQGFLLFSLSQTSAALATCVHHLLQSIVPNSLVAMTKRGSIIILELNQNKYTYMEI